MIKSILLAFLLVQFPAGEYEPGTNRTFYTLNAKSESGYARRVRFILSHPGKDRAQIDGVIVRLEIRQRAQPAAQFTSSLAIHCGGTIQRQIDVSNNAFDAETLAISASLKPEEARALLNCESPRLTLAGIEVTLSKDLLAQLRAVLTS